MSGLLPEATIDATSSSVSYTRYAYGPIGITPFAMVRDGVTYRIVTDHIGSVRAVVRASDGLIMEARRYDAWGNLKNHGEQSSWSPIPFGFAGGLEDRATGLVRFGARDYYPSIGRWMSRDPALFRGGSSNLYAYANNDPVNYMDIAGSTPQSANSLIDAVTANRPMTGADLDAITWINLMKFRHPDDPSAAWGELKEMRDQSNGDLSDILQGFGERPGVVAAEHYLYARYFSRYATPFGGMILSNGYHYFKLVCGAVTSPIPGGPWYGFPLGSGPVTPPSDLQFSWGSYGAATAWSDEPE